MKYVVFFMIICGVLACKDRKISKNEGCLKQFKSLVKVYWKPVDYGDWNPKYVFKKDSVLIGFLEREGQTCLKGVPVDSITKIMGSSIKKSPNQIKYQCVDEDDSGLDSVLCIRFFFDQNWKMNELRLQQGCSRAID